MEPTTTTYNGKNDPTKPGRNTVYVRPASYVQPMSLRIDVVMGKTDPPEPGPITVTVLEDIERARLTELRTVLEKALAEYVTATQHANEIVVRLVAMPEETQTESPVLFMFPPIPPTVEA